MEYLLLTTNNYDFIARPEKIVIEQHIKRRYGCIVL